MRSRMVDVCPTIRILFALGLAACGASATPTPTTADAQSPADAQVAADAPAPTDANATAEVPPPDAGADLPVDNRTPDAGMPAPDGGSWTVVDARGGLDTGPAEGRANVGDFGERYAGLSCKKAFACCPATSLALIAETEQDCLEVLAAQGFADELNFRFNGEIQAGYIVYDPVLAKRCLSDFAALSCEALRAPGEGLFDIPSCRNAFRPTRRAGETCNEDFACVNGWCDLDTGGICAEPALVGASCDSHAQCTSRECSDLGVCVPATTDSFCPQ
ncbi:MAG TPA: hypothetical protein VGG33_17865 [Polyangia bacterium]